jgi:glutaredoxin-related protein
MLLIFKEIFVTLSAAYQTLLKLYKQSRTCTDSASAVSEITAVPYVYDNYSIVSDTLKLHQTLR